MSTKTEELLIKILRAVAVDCEADKACELLSKLTGDEMKSLFSLAQKHQLGHYVAYIMMTRGDERFSKPFYSAAGLTAKQQVAVGEISEKLTARELEYIMLKGVVLRRLYPEPWMRNSCDVDVFVKEEKLKEAEAVLEELGYEKKMGLEGMSAHDVQFDKNKVHVELHYALIAENLYPKVDAVLSRVWSCSSADDGYQHFMTDEFFYFYHIAHMLKHFENGGFGVRPILDLWFLNNKCEFSKEKRDELLSEGGLLKFEREMVRLSQYWFSDGDGEGLETLVEYLLTGGAYGTTKNSVSLRKSKRGGRLSYFMSRIFAPYSLLRRYYPVLNKYPILLPFYEVKRWIDALRRDKTKYVRELRENVRDDDALEKNDKMLTTLGLKENKGE